MKQKTCKTEKRIFLGVTTLWVVLAIVVSLMFSANADATLTQAVGIEGLSVTCSGTKDWTGSANGASWSGKTSSSSNNCETIYTPQNGTLTFKNDSDTKKIISFDYSIELNDGSVSIAGTEFKDGNGSFLRELDAGATLVVSASSVGSEHKKEGTTTITISNIEFESPLENSTVVFSKPTNGSYTLDGVTVSADVTKTDTVSKTYNLVATPADNYLFEGWYLGTSLLSVDATLSNVSFPVSGTLTAKFKEEPLFSQTNVPSGSAYSKGDLVVINSAYFHDSSTKLVVPGGFPTHQSAYTITSETKVKDAIDSQFVPSRPWTVSNGAVSYSFSARATGEYIAENGERSWVYARIHSDVIRIYAKENCKISFDYSHSISGGSSSDSYSKLYYAISANNLSVAQVKAGTQLTTGSGTIDSLSLSAGDCLYIVVEGYAKNSSYALLSKDPAVMNFSCAASISNFTVSYNDNSVSLNTGFQDNIGTVLSTGKIVMNSESHDISTIETMSLAGGSAMNFRVGTVPNGYVHIGWAVTIDGKTQNYYTDTYDCTFTADTTVMAIFVPKMTITMGEKGYGDATYKMSNGNAVNGHYVARNADQTAFYTTLKQAFDSTDIVVLLAGDVINGDWVIPEGKTLVIPRTLSDSVDIVPPKSTVGYSGIYCQVTLNGDLTVEGSLLVSAMQHYSTGVPAGTVGQLLLNSGATVTVNGTVYGYGPVIGEGEIVANASATVHELVEIADVAGGVTTKYIYDAREEKHVFPVNNMFINTIEVKVTYYAGATLEGHGIFSFDTTEQTSFTVVGADEAALLYVVSGSVTKHYNTLTGQVEFRVNECSVVETGTFSISVSATMAGQTLPVTLNSSDYLLPLNASWKLISAGDLTIKGNFKFLPGAMLDILHGGTVTIDENSTVVFYRMNDYDNRGRRPSATEFWGYSMRAYPMNSSRHPSVFNADNIGSAKLNVDGKLIVNGGLYVTDKLQTDTENGIVIRANGYNYLTGHGTIDMTGAQTSLESINEFMLCQTNSVGWDTVTVKSMKGLKPDATADEPEQYSSLSGVVGGVLNSNNLNVWLADAPELNVAYRLNDYLWFNGYFTGVNIDEVSSGVDMVPITKAGVTTTYIVKAILAKDIPNDLVFTITFTLDDAQYTRQFTVNLASYDAGNDEALKQALLIYGEAAEDSFAGNVNEKPAGVTRPGGLPGELIVFEEQAGSVSSGSQASNVTVSRYGMTIGFGNCLQFIYGFRVNDAAGITDWSNIVEIGLLYSDVAGTLEAKKESFA